MDLGIEKRHIHPGTSTLAGEQLWQVCMLLFWNPRKIYAMKWNEMKSPSSPPPPRPYYTHKKRMPAVSLTQAGTDVSPKLAQSVEFLSCVQEEQEKLCPLLSCTKIIRNVARQTTPKVANEFRAISGRRFRRFLKFRKKEISNVQRLVPLVSLTTTGIKTRGRNERMGYDCSRHLTNMR